jgi:hypothetical protein
MDIVKRFIDEVCVLESDAKTVNSTLWKGFEVWCSENHLEPLTHQNFFNRLARFPGIQRCKVGGIRGGAGIRLKQTGGSAESMIQERAQFVEV